MINSFFPALAFVDSALATFLPDIVRLCLWGALAGVLALLVYRWSSDQAGIRDLKAQTRQFRREMMNSDLEHEAFMALVRKNLYASLKLLRKVILPSVLASAPVIVPAAWLAFSDGYLAPGEGETLTIEVVPPEARVRASDGVVKDDAPGTFHLVAGGDHNDLALYDDDGVVWLRDADAALYPNVQKKQWWNAILANEAGYVREDSEVSEINLSYRRKAFIENAPLWLVTWEFPFFVSVLIAAIIAKFALRIE